MTPPPKTSDAPPPLQFASTIPPTSLRSRFNRALAVGKDGLQVYSGPPNVAPDSKFPKYTQSRWSCLRLTLPGFLLQLSTTRWMGSYWLS